MKFNIIDENECEIFVNNLYIKNINLSNDVDLESFLRKVILNIKNVYNIELKGLYDAIIYYNEKIGVLIKLKNKDIYNFNSNTIDLKILLFNNYLFYFKTKEYDIISKYSDIYYYLNYYYIDASLIDNILQVIEYGEIILSDECENIKKL